MFCGDFLCKLHVKSVRGQVKHFPWDWHRLEWFVHHKWPSASCKENPKCVKCQFLPHMKWKRRSNVYCKQVPIIGKVNEKLSPQIYTQMPIPFPSFRCWYFNPINDQPKCNCHSSLIFRHQIVPSSTLQWYLIFSWRRLKKSRNDNFSQPAGKAEQNRAC